MANAQTEVTDMGERKRQPDMAREARKVVASSVVGTTIEFYDFSLYGLAAVLVFGPQFFPSGDPVAAQLSALATFAAGFLVRPIGSIIAGHFGDRIGRKKVLVTSFMLMGAATLLIAVLPTYSSVGVLAPLLLVLVRIMQGMAAGAEYGGAALMAVEHAPKGKKGIYGAAPGLGIAIGTILAYLVMVIVSNTAKDAFVNGGWRIAFGVSVVLIVVGMVVRNKISESPLFEEAVRRDQAKPNRVPLASVLAHHPVAVLLGMGWATISASFGYIVQPYSVGYAAQAHGYGQNLLLWAVIAGSAVKIVCVLLSGKLMDVVPRRAALIIIAVLQIISVAMFFPLLGTGKPGLAFLAFIIGLATIGLVNATIGSVLANLFPTNVAYTGVSLTYNLSYSIGGTAPLIAASILAGTGSMTWVGILLSTLAVIALFVAIFRRKA